MRLIKAFTLAALAAVAAMAFAGATPASATSTQLCTSHSGLTCSGAAASGHMVLASGEVIIFTIDNITILCLGYLIEANVTGDAGVPGDLVTNGPQTLTSVTQTFSNCGTGPTHSNCTVTIPQQPSFNLLKTGLDQATMPALSGQIRYVCSNLGLNCLYDLEGAEFAVGSGHFSAEETEITELGGKFLCSNESYLSGLLESLTSFYVLG